MTASADGAAPPSTERRPARARSSPKIDDRLVKAVRTRLGDNKRVRRTLPDGGRVNIDRQLPFLVLYRPPQGPDAGTDQFVRSEASYLVAPGGKTWRDDTKGLGLAIAETLSEPFGGFLVVEVWAGPESDALPSDDGSPAPPAFKVVTSRTFAQSTTVDELVAGLERIVLFKHPAQVERVPGGRVGPKGQGAFLTAAEARRLNAAVIGVEVSPVYRSHETGEVYPIACRHLARRMSRAIRQACFEFTRRETSARPRHYQSLGTRAFTKAAWEVDAKLAEISSSFDVLLYVTPTNAASAFADFKASKFERAPNFFYRPRDVDLGELKRRLHATAIDRVEDPTLAHLYREKKGELDLQLSLVIERETSRFQPLGIALYGRVDDGLVATAEDLLAKVTGSSSARKGSVSAERFVQRAHEELNGYRSAYPPFDTDIHLRDELTSLMVSKGQLLVGRHMTFPVERVEPLLQHEVGTHVVTHWNGQAQPLKLLSAGLANYDELQEGLAVFAEYLAAGLTPARMRTLAGRVIAARMLTDGAEFVETFRALREACAFTDHMAWQITMRIYRGGGYVKDSVYLRGLQSVLDYLADGGHLETLLIGKIAVEHAPIIEELQRRRVLNPPPLRPAYLDDPDGQVRLDRARRGIGLVDLVEP